jgi:hypothetical protein
VNWAIMMRTIATSDKRIVARTVFQSLPAARLSRAYIPATKPTARTSSKSVTHGAQFQECSTRQTVPSPATVSMPSNRWIQSGREPFMGLIL